MLVLALAATGLSLRLLGPRGWDELGDGLDRGLEGIQTIDWPYAGPDEWVRLTILLGAPVLLAVAAALAFWPVRRGARAMRLAALVLLLVLYGTSVTEHDPGAPLLRGFVLLVLVAAWLWLPRLSRREALTGAVVVASVGHPGRAGGRVIRRRSSLVELPRVEPVRRRPRGHVRLEPLVRPARLAARRHDAAQRRVRPAAVLEGRDARRLRRLPLAAHRREQPDAGPARPPRDTAARGPDLELLRVQPALGRAVPGDRPLAVEPVRGGRGDHLQGRRGRAHVQLAGRDHDPRERRAARARRHLHRAGLRAGSDRGADARGAGRLVVLAAPVHHRLAARARRERPRRRVALAAGRRAAVVGAGAPARRPGGLRHERGRRAARLSLRAAPTASPSSSPAASRPPTTRSSPSRTTCSATCATASARPARGFRSTPSCSRTRSATASSSPARWR